MPAHAVAKTLSASEDRTFVTNDFHLHNGQMLPEMRLAYVTLGELAPDGSNAILLTHGFTSSHRLSNKASHEASEGGWNLLVGPGKPIDTNRYFVVSSNMLGSSFGSTGPSSINPETGKPYGPRFPKIGLHDIIAAQRILLDSLGVTRLRAIIGASYGGFQAFQWAIDFPQAVQGIVAAMSSLWWADDGETVETLYQRLAKNPNWNAGDYYTNGGIFDSMVSYRIDTLRKYGREDSLRLENDDPAWIAANLQRQSEAWARQFDGNSLITLLRAAETMDIAAHAAAIRAKVLFLLSSTDKIFPPSLAPKVMGVLQAGNVDASYFLLESPRGHSASHEDAEKWAPRLREFLEQLDAENMTEIVNI